MTINDLTNNWSTKKNLVYKHNAHMTLLYVCKEQTDIEKIIKYNYSRISITKLACSEC